MNQLIASYYTRYSELFQSYLALAREGTLLTEDGTEAPFDAVRMFTTAAVEEIINEATDLSVKVIALGKFLSDLLQVYPALIETN